jgi:hypothetical protein
VPEEDSNDLQGSRFPGDASMFAYDTKLSVFGTIRNGEDQVDLEKQKHGTKVSQN